MKSCKSDKQFMNTLNCRSNNTRLTLVVLFGWYSTCIVQIYKQGFNIARFYSTSRKYSLGQMTRFPRL